MISTPSKSWYQPYYCNSYVIWVTVLFEMLVLTVDSGFSFLRQTELRNAAALLVALVVGGVVLCAVSLGSLYLFSLRLRNWVVVLILIGLIIGLIWLGTLLSGFGFGLGSLVYLSIPMLLLHMVLIRRHAWLLYYGTILGTILAGWSLDSELVKNTPLSLIIEILVVIFLMLVHHVWLQYFRWSPVIFKPMVVGYTRPKLSRSLGISGLVLLIALTLGIFGSLLLPTITPPTSQSEVFSLERNSASYGDWDSINNIEAEDIIPVEPGQLGEAGSKSSSSDSSSIFVSSSSGSYQLSEYDSSSSANLSSFSANSSLSISITSGPTSPTSKTSPTQHPDISWINWKLIGILGLVTIILAIVGWIVYRLVQWRRYHNLFDQYLQQVKYKAAILVKTRILMTYLWQSYPESRDLNVLESLQAVIAILPPGDQLNQNLHQIFRILNQAVFDWQHHIDHTLATEFNQVASTAIFTLNQNLSRWNRILLPFTPVDLTPFKYEDVAKDGDF